MLHALIMAGGGGTRFWPRSRRTKPKQFITLMGERTLLQMTAERLESQVSPANTWIVTGADHRDEVIRELPHIPANQIIGEPCPRDTAPCVALGAALIANRDPDAVMLVMPADHMIEPAQEFRRIVHAAEQLVPEHPESLVTFGITPTWASTGYGYIHKGESLEGRQGLSVFKVNRFREKPDEATAKTYLDSGEYFWNAGIFVGKASVFLEQFSQHEPTMRAGVDRIASAWNSPRQELAFAEEFPLLHKISFDFAVMEKCPNVLVMAAQYNWDDIGSWLAMERMHPHDADGNTVLANHVGLKTQDCIVVGESDKIIATLGVNNLVIVQDGNCILVIDKSKESEVKLLVEELKKRGLEMHL
jgi:mannose-1-phosphate guanylyltransferase